MRTHARCPASLRDTQAELVRLITAPAQLESTYGRRALERLLRSSAPVAPALGLGAYAGGYPVRLREALADTFEAVARYVGDAEFGALTLRYIAAHPPSGYNLNDVGRSLPRFLRGDRLLTGFPFLADLAALEWKISRAFHAELRPPADTTGLGELTEDEWTRLALELQPGVGTVVSRWPVRALWECRDTARERTGMGTGNAECVLVYRHGQLVRLEPTGKEEARALRAVGRGRLLSSALESAARGVVSVSEAAVWPARWQRLGIVSGWRLAGTP